MPRSRNSGSMFERFERHAQKNFGEAAARYLQEFQGKDRTRPSQSIDAVMPYIGSLRLIDVDDEAMQQFKHDRTNGLGAFDRPAMAGTTNKDITQVVTILGKACRVWRWLPSVPKIEYVRGPSRQAYPFSWAEQDKLFGALPTGWDCGAALFAVNTGVRKEELFGLKWTHRQWVPELDIKDASGNVIERMYVFLLGDTKNGEQRAVICNSLARRAVAYQEKFQAKDGFFKSDYVFPTRVKGKKATKVRDAGVVWDRAWKAAGLPSGRMVKRGIHNCRHTCGHRLRAVGCPQEDRNAYLGHAKANLSEHYATTALERLLHWGELIAIRKETTILRVVG
jgi:integrase